MIWCMRLIWYAASGDDADVYSALAARLTVRSGWPSAGECDTLREA